MKFLKESVIKASPEKVFNFHLLPDAFERLTPPWENVKIIQLADITKVGSRAIIEMKVFGVVPAQWVAEHTAYDPPRMFEDTQVSGPFKKWVHKHIVEPHEQGAILRDDIEFEGPVSTIFDGFIKPLVVPKLEKMFEYRHEATRKYCEEGE